MSVAGTLALCFGTVQRADFDQLVEAAAEVGVEQVTVSPDLYWSARESGRSDAQLRAVLAREGITVAMIDPLIQPLPGLPPLDNMSPFVRRMFSFTDVDCFAAAEALAAPLVNLGQPQGQVVPLPEMVEAVGTVGDRAATRGLQVGLEFVSNSLMVGTLASALEVVTAVDRANVGLVFDVWHFFRSGGEVEELAGVPADRVLALQISDAAPDSKGRRPASLEDRLVPGDGGIPIRPIVAALANANANANAPNANAPNANAPNANAGLGLGIGVEVFSSVLSQLPVAEAARRAVEAARRTLEA